MPRSITCTARVHRLLLLGLPLLLSIALNGCNESPSQKKIVEVSISSAGSFKVEDRNVPEAELKREFKALQAGRAGTVKLHINADPNAPFEAAGKVTKAAQDAGIGEIAFVTSAPKK